MNSRWPVCIKSTMNIGLKALYILMELKCVCHLCQDLPAHFEDNMEPWMKNFLVLLMTDIPGLEVKGRFCLQQRCI